MRLIDADALMRRIEDSARNAGLHSEDYRKIKRFIAITHTIDAEPVVRCKDCKYFMFGDYCMHGGVMEHSHARENDFCSYGERRAADADEDELD